MLQRLGSLAIAAGLALAAAAGCRDDSSEGTPPDVASADDTAVLDTAVADTAATETGAGDTGVADATPADGSGPDASTEADTGTDAGSVDEDAPDATGSGPGVYVVLFTHIEDNSPAGELGDEKSKTGYSKLRGKLIQVAALAKAYDLQWVLQPDWRYLEAGLLYEDDGLKADTGGKNLLVYLRDDLGAVVDPHSHEHDGYNYTDVAYLLEKLGVGGTTVIGGHIWDPALPQFQEWDRFREPVPGEKYPDALWRGDILIGAGTPNHTNDPLVSGLWRPLDRDHFYTDDPTGNIVAVGAWHDDVAGVHELVDLHAAGAVPPGAMLTASWNIGLSEITAEGGLATIEETVFAPLAAMRDQGQIVVTDFTSLVATWQSKSDGKACLYHP